MRYVVRLLVVASDVALMAVFVRRDLRSRCKRCISKWVRCYQRYGRCELFVCGLHTRLGLLKRKRALRCSRCGRDLRWDRH